MNLPACGIHHDVSFDDYALWPAANFSTVKAIRNTASKCKYAIDNPKELSTAMALGQALHVATLEPARFDGMFHICPPCDRRTKEGKELYEAECRKAGGKILIREGDESLGEVERVRGMSAALHALKSADPFLHGAGRNEVSMLWKDEDTGLMCKGRVDRLIENFPGLDLPVIVEIKSTKNANAWGFGKDVDTMSYAAQAACYRAGYTATAGKAPMHVFLAVESFAPFDAAVFTLDDESMQTGLLQYRQMLKRYAECLKTGLWPGYPDHVQILSMPKYANERTYEP
jgi:hypothetical protein